MISGNPVLQLLAALLILSVVAAVFARLFLAARSSGRRRREYQMATASDRLALDEEMLSNPELRANTQPLAPRFVAASIGIAIAFCVVLALYPRLGAVLIVLLHVIGGCIIWRQRARSS